MGKAAGKSSSLRQWAFIEERRRDVSTGGKDTFRDTEHLLGIFGKKPVREIVGKVYLSQNVLLTVC